MVDVTLSEHALFARAKMLNIAEDQIHRRIPIQTIFSRLSPMETTCALADGADQDCVDYLKATFETSLSSMVPAVDPRIYAIREWDWIRTRKNLFYARKWCTNTQQRLLESRAFWDLQPSATDDSWLVLYDLDGNEMGGTLGALKQRLKGVE